MVYADKIGVIFYWKPDYPYYLHIAHHVWFDEYKSHLFTENNHTSGYLLI